ncbi:MAG TPA: TetR/AcrR family transcriptional regulator [Syntrophomonadaceae bacterium]|nr:TetR/AcrR family transcriptional regulator [Syntrophomonadaceae bacterium]
MAETVAAPTTKERIITATLDIIASEGFQNVTVRKIATQAHVNIAAAHYHFGSKDAVIERALQYVTTQMIEVFTILTDQQQPADIRLRSFIQAYADTVYKYPDIVKYMIDQRIHHTNCQVEYGAFLERQGIVLVSQTLKELNPGSDAQLHLMKTLQILSCISFPILLAGQIRTIAGLDLFDQETRAHFITMLIDSVLEPGPFSVKPDLSS